MKTNNLLFLFLLFWVIDGQAQSKHSIFLNSGYAFNPSFELNGAEAKDLKGMVINFGVTYRMFRLQFMSSEIGLGGKSIFSSGVVNGDKFNAATLRLIVPVKFVFPVSDKQWMLSGGFVFQNNVDASKVDFRLRDKYSWRVDFLFETKYLLKNQWYLTAGANFNLRDIPDSFFINDPRTSIVVGIARSLYLVKSKKRKL